MAGEHRYVVGWCPECKAVRVRVDGQEGDCGHGLMYRVPCEDETEVGLAVIFMEKLVHGDKGVQDGRAAERDAACALSDLFGLFMDATGEDDDEDEDWDVMGRGDVHEFMVTATPFPVWVRGEDYMDAVNTLRKGCDRFVAAGFGAALMEGSIDLHFVPVAEGSPAFIAEKETDGE